MIAPLRRAHRAIFVVLAAVLPTVLVTAVVNRPGSTETLPARVEIETPSTEAIEGCWGTLPVRLTLSSPGPLERLAAAEAGSMPVSSPIPTREEDDALAGERDGVRTSTGSTVVHFESGEELALSGNVVVHALLSQQVVSRVRLLASPRHPDLAAYWIPGIVDGVPDLAAGAVHLARVSVDRPATLVYPPTPRQGATLALYSVGHDETVGVIHLRPDAIIHENCR